MSGVAQAVIPGGVRGAKLRARRPGTHSTASQICKWVPDRAHMPNFKTAGGASGMTIWAGVCP
ncbi:hypothetical protein GCM10008941_34860 [Rhizomicrobium palustre]